MNNMKNSLLFAVYLMISLFVMNEAALANGQAASSASVVTAGSPVAAQGSLASVKDKKEPTEGRLWNLQDADILSIINEVSQETGKNFVVDPRVSGKISLVSSKPLKQQEVYQVFLSVLGILGYSAIPSGNVIKIVPNMESGEQTTPVLGGKEKAGRSKGEEVIVRVIPLENVSATQLLPILRPMLPQWSNISAYTPGNVLIVLGRASNLDRILTIIQDVDKAATSGIEIIPLRHASAAQLVAVINNLQAASKAAGDTSVPGVAVDERSNSLLLSGVKSARLRLRALISQLDAPSKIPSGNTEVVYLRYLEAKTFAPILGRVVQNMLGKGNAGSSVSESTSPQTSALGATTTTNVSTKDSVTNATNIQAETNTNALIITATPAIMESIKKVIARLDVRPAQVLVEAVIAQVEESNTKSLGIQWGNLVTNAQNAINNSSNNTNSTNNNGGFAQPGVGVIGIIPGIRIQAVLSMLQTLNGVDILSTPSVMVLDNRQASIEIGQSLPITTGQYTTQSAQQNGVATPFTTQSYRDVTLKLDVTPQINLGNAVRLKINLKNDTVSGTVQPGINPQINTSTIKNSVLVNNEDVLVIGGLMSNTTNETIERIPLIADIPVIGRAFQRKGMDRAKKNLMVFIKTTIVHEGVDGTVLSKGKYHYIKQQQANHHDNLYSIDRDSNENRLPPWQNPKDLPGPFEKGKTETVAVQNRLPPWQNSKDLPVPFERGTVA